MRGVEFPKVITPGDNFREHGSTRNMDVIISILASMDALEHGCTRNVNVMILASMDALPHGCSRDMNVIILASMDAFNHGCIRDMNKKGSCPILPRKVL